MMLWSSCFPQAPASGAALAGTAAATAWEGERKKGRGLERLGGGRRGRGEGGREGGGNLSPLQCLRLSSPADSDRVLPPHPLPVPRPLLHPPSFPPSLPSVQEESRSLRAAQGAGGGGGSGGGGCVRVCEGRHLLLLRSQAAAGGGASRSGSGGDSGGGFRSPAAKMLKVTVPSCSSSSCSSVTASVAPGAGSLVPDYWIEGSNRDALSDFFEVESELGR